MLDAKMDIRSDAPIQANKFRIDGFESVCSCLADETENVGKLVVVLHERVVWRRGRVSFWGKQIYETFTFHCAFKEAYLSLSGVYLLLPAYFRGLLSLYARHYAVTRFPQHTYYLTRLIIAVFGTVEDVDVTKRGRCFLSWFSCLKYISFEMVNIVKNSIGKRCNKITFFIINEHSVFFI